MSGSVPVFLEIGEPMEVNAKLKRAIFLPDEKNRSPWEE